MGQSNCEVFGGGGRGGGGFRQMETSTHNLIKKGAYFQNW